MNMFNRRAQVLWLWGCATAGTLGLVGCDQLGIETPQRSAEKQVAEAKAIGSACRHAMRAIEDCYTMNPKVEKASIFDGWREMDEYMRENKLEGIAPVVPRPAALTASSAASAASSASDVEDEEPVPSGDSASAAPRKRSGKSSSH